MKPWSNLAKVVYKRTFSRNDTGRSEDWKDTVERVISGNIAGHNVSPKEIERLKYFMLNRKAMPAGRGLWYSGSPSHKGLGGAALNNCWVVTGDTWENLVLAQDLLMLGGGVGITVEHRFVSKLPKVKKNVTVTHKPTKDADYIVPDSREGWCELTRRVLESHFVTGKSFSYSTVCVRGAGEDIRGFGGKSSGPIPLINFIEKMCRVLQPREGKHIRPIDMMDLLCCIGEMVVAGNVRRSAIIILGDPWDKEYLKSKRWDLGTIPTHRAMANLSVVVDDIEDLHPLFWKTYEQGEPFGIVNRKNMRKFGRMGEAKPDNCVAVNPCGEATLEDGEPCNLQEIFMPNLENLAEFIEAGRLMHRWGKRVTCETYHNPKNQEVVKRNRRIGTGITGCLQSHLFEAAALDEVYKGIQLENLQSSAELDIPQSIRTTVVKPSGTLSLLGDCTPGIHPAFSKQYIRRVRFAANDPLIPILKAAGHYMEPVVRFDNSLDHGTLVVNFYVEMPDGTPCADENFDTWKQLNTVLFAQKHWADQAVSVTVYYYKDETPLIKEWLGNNLKNLKTISFLCHNDHGFKQAPMEAISKEQFNKLSSSVKPINAVEVGDGVVSLGECEGGACPVK